MAITIQAYGLFLESLCESRVDFEKDNLMCMLVGAGYSPNYDIHKFKSAVTYEVVGSGYIAGGKAVEGVSASYSAVDNKLTIDGSDLLWPSLSISGIKYGVLYMDTGGAVSAMPLVACINFDAAISPSSEALYITWPATGIIKLAVP